MSEEASTPEACRGCVKACCCRSEASTYSMHHEALVSAGEIVRIERATGRSDFYEERESHYAEEAYYTLRLRDDGTCLFFEPQVGQCSIYDIRPVDCRLFPLDFDEFDEDDTNRWFLWACPLSEQLDATAVEDMIAVLEDRFAEEIRAIWNAGEPTKDLRGTGVLRILREVDIETP